MENNPTQTKPKKPKRPHNKKIDYIVSIVVNAVILYIVNNLLNWEVQFITWKWPEVLWILNTSIIVSIVLYASFLIYAGRLYYFLGRTAMDIIGIVVAYRMFTVFPFDFNGLFEMGWLNTWAPYLLWVGIVGVSISIVVRTVRLIANKNIYY